METLKKDIKGAFYELAEVMDANMKNLKDDTNQKCKTLADTVMKMYSKMCKPGKQSDVNLPQKKMKKKPGNKPQTKVSSVIPEPSSKAAPSLSSTTSSKAAPSPSSNTSSKTAQISPPNEPRNKSKGRFLSKPKVLYVGDSIGNTANMRMLENDGSCRIRTARAYSSVYNDAARWPKYNFTDVVNYNLGNPGREDYEMLVMSAPTVDITNLDTTKLTPSGNTEYYKQEVIMSCRNMFSLAQASLDKHSNLSKVIIMEHPPRFDQPNVDPTSLKSKLARLANATLNQLWVISPLKDKIIVGHHSLVSSRAEDAHFARYQDFRTGRYDGVHLYGHTWCKDYTASVKLILRLADDHTSCAQAKYQSRYQKDEYSYQRRTNTSYQKDVNQGMYWKDGNQGKYHPYVQVSNRFSALSSNMGNY